MQAEDTTETLLPKLIKADEVAEVLGVTKRTVYSLVERGELPAVKIGGALRFRPRDVAALMGLGEEVA